MEDLLRWVAEACVQPFNTVAGDRALIEDGWIEGVDVLSRHAVEKGDAAGRDAPSSVVEVAVAPVLQFVVDQAVRGTHDVANELVDLPLGLRIVRSNVGPLSAGADDVLGRRLKIPTRGDIAGRLEPPDFKVEVLSCNCRWRLVAMVRQAI